MSNNIDYWEKILIDPTPPFKKLFTKEERYLKNHIVANSRVLDIGCGNGRVIRFILDVTKNITGVDNDPRAIQDAQKNLVNIPEVKLVLADAVKLPFPDESFDYVLLMDSLVNFAENKIKILVEMRRVLRKDGKIIMSAYSEEAFDARSEIYKKINLPIQKINGTTFIFPERIGSYQSEQFSQEEMVFMATEAGLKISNQEKIDKLAYILELNKLG